MSSTCYFCLLLLMSLFHLCVSTKNLNHVLCKDIERQALLRFKHGLIDRADRLASWISEEKECCSWAGIVCDNFTGHVQQIHLRGVDGRCEDYTTTKEYVEVSKRRLGGDLSPSLLQLKQLEHLDLSCNNFSGIQVPSFMGSLGSLRYLNISRSKFGGIIPPQLGNLSKLQVLCLGSNDDTYRYEFTSMSNMQWLSRLSWLHHLDMSGVDLYKAIDWFQVINTLPSLVQLHLSNCQLLHIHPLVPCLNLTSLSLLDLSDNYFLNSSMPRWIFSLTSLVSLDLSMCNFHGHIPGSVDSFRNLTSLEFLHVGGNDFMNSSSVLKGLSSVGSNLVSLDIGSCGVTSSVLDALHNLTSLLSLDLSYNHLSKAIPKSLGNLCNLKEIDMSYNDFRNISLTFLLESFFECKSPHLESLYLYWNLVYGPIPYSIGGLTSLEVLDLNYNLVSGPIPYSIGGLLLLESLDLSHNRLNGSLPDSLGQLSKLYRLDFSDNLLNGIVTKAHFAKLASLTYLDGSGNNLTFRPQPVNWVPPFQLRYLHVSGWGLGPQFPLWLKLQRDLEELDISNTNISAPIPQSFWRSFPNLRYINISQNNIQGTLFSIPATLDVMDLSSNEFRGQLPHLSNRPSIYFLDLSDNLFAGSLHHFLCPSDVISIGFLNLGNNNLSSVIPECWEKWRSLSYINLENNNLQGEIPKTLGFLNQLQALNMHGNKLTGRLPPSLMNLTHLEILQLGKNELFGSIPAWFGRKLSFLRILNLRLNNFDGNIPHELCYLSVIQIVDLAHNNMSGNIPRCFNNFSVITGEKAIVGRHFMINSSAGNVLPSDELVMKGREDTYDSILGLVMLLDLSNNKFSGHIPNELTTLKMLTSLNLSRNQLTGRIPETIGDMKSLISFDVSLNQLSGELPVSLSRLSFLSSFNVSYNRLTGRVPSSTQLQSFNESSFFGNKLCGDPLTNHCVVEVPDRDHEEDDDGAHGADWGLIISMVLGSFAGFWIIMAPLIVSTSWRIAYFRFLTGLSYMVCDVVQKYCRNMFRR